MEVGSLLRMEKGKCQRRRRESGMKGVECVGGEEASAKIESGVKKGRNSNANFPIGFM